MAEIVFPGASSDQLNVLELPMIMVTASVSPMARPKASITPPTMPEIAAGNITFMMAPHRVVPTP